MFQGNYNSQFSENRNALKPTNKLSQIVKNKLFSTWILYCKTHVQNSNGHGPHGYILTMNLFFFLILYLGKYKRICEHTIYKKGKANGCLKNINL